MPELQLHFGRSHAGRQLSHPHSTIGIPVDVRAQFGARRPEREQGQQQGRAALAGSRDAALPPDVRERFLSRYASRLTTEGVLIVSSQRHRDQARNTADVLEKLRGMLVAVARPPKVRRATKPSRSPVERRKTAKQVRSRTKQMRRTVGDD